MKYLLFFLFILLATKSQAQRTLSGSSPYVYRDFLYYECANYFIIPPHPKAILNDMGEVVVSAPIKTDSLPIIRPLSGQATLEIYEKVNIFQITPHSIEPITFICHTDTITFQVFYLTYDHAEISLHSHSYRPYDNYTQMRLLPNLKNNYSIGNVTIKEKYHSFQEIFFNADTLRTRMQKDTTLFMRFHLGISKYKEALVRYRNSRLRVDSITVKLKDETGKLLRANIIMPYYGYWIKLNKLIDYQNDIKRGYSLEISCTTVFIDNYEPKKMKIYQDYYYCNGLRNRHNSYNEINYPNESLLVEDNYFMYPSLDINDNDWSYETDDGWGDSPFGAEPCKEYGIPAVFRMKFY
jgi:hypothetical protein